MITSIVWMDDHKLLLE